MKVISFNANGIRAAARRGFFDWLVQQDADIICLQETKIQKNQLEPQYYPENYYCEYVCAEKKGYSGVAIFSKKAPSNIINNYPFSCCSNEGRYLQFDYETFSVVSLYLPSGTSGASRQEIKYIFLEQFSPYLFELKQKRKNLIICGDYNIAHKEIDLRNWKTNQKTSGFLPKERAFMDSLFNDLGFVDAFRVLNKDKDQYTWWSYRHKNAWINNVGWRIDYQVITPGLTSTVKDVSIARSVRYSDHAPLIIEYYGI